MSHADHEWAKEQIATYGRDNEWVMAFILGEFPPGSINTLISPELVDKAMKRALRLGDGMRGEQGWHATDCQPTLDPRSPDPQTCENVRILVGATGFVPVRVERSEMRRA